MQAKIIHHQLKIAKKIQQIKKREMKISWLEANREKKRRTKNNKRSTLVIYLTIILMKINFHTVEFSTFPQLITLF